MKFSQKLKNEIQDLHLLNHPFYQKWEKGEISKDTLKEYAAQYLFHVEAFPRYISATHSLCPDIESRRVLLENLNEEEGLHSVPHPTLWRNFARALNSDLKDSPCSSIQNVTQTFFQSADSSYEEGLASLYAYEYQVPEVAKTKIDGLKRHYDINKEKDLEFFTVHQSADVYHREACEELLDQFPEEKQELAVQAAKKSAQALWDFLSSMDAIDHAA